MKRVPPLIATTAFVMMSGIAVINALPAAWADKSTQAPSAVAEQTVTFTVEKMTCAACPITVRKLMEGVEGVQSVAVDFEAKTATVVFDPTVTTSEQIGAASTNAGYRASPTS